MTLREQQEREERRRARAKAEERERIEAHVAEQAKELDAILAANPNALSGGPGPAPRCPHGQGFHCRVCYPSDTQ